ncbi:hypothetical protein [Nocardia carnea]|uniref:hypothetical protein n=1 Tax=Nocardia carnea TaxID=37328 RepID=UPI0024558A2A|nr:hypothetical protein [Nocardia carnea]
MTIDPGAGAAIAPLLFKPYTDCWDPSRWLRIEHALRRESNVYEHDISAMLCSLNPPWEAPLVQLLCRATGRDYDDAMRVYTTQQFVKSTNSALDRRVPDFVVGRDHDGVVVPEIIVELKGNAWINGGWDYCPRYGDDVYSNQVLCYLHGCWTSVDLRDVAFCWIGLRAIVDNPVHEFPWGNKAVNERDGRDSYGLRIAYRRHRIAALHWRPLTIEDVAEVLRATDGGDVLADLIDVWSESCAGVTPSDRSLQARRTHDS